MHLNQLLKVFAFTLIAFKNVFTNLYRSRNEEPALQTHRHACFTHVTRTQNQETEVTWVQGKRNWRVVVCLCLCIQGETWQKPEFQWIRMSSRVQCVWISWRIQWPSIVDTVTVRSVLQAAGIRRIRWESTAALSADRPSVQDLL